MDDPRIVDAFPAFESLWAGVRLRPPDEQLDGWAAYMARWPELLAKQVQDCADQGLDWRAVARERILPRLDAQMPAMRTARDHLLGLCVPMMTRARQTLEFRAPLTLVIHVGIGCGAGWATDYEGSQAILLGLENIAEEGWIDPAALSGLLAHEMGHLIQRQWRTDARLSGGTGPWWELYTEGFAQRCEHLILGRESWHMASGSDAGWLAWCRAHRGWLASEFVRRADAGEPVRDFFGSWFDLCGRKQCGYYLGHEAIRWLEGRHSLPEIARLKDCETAMRSALAQIARAH